MKLNPKLNIGDKIVLLYMEDDYAIIPGTKGVVKRVVEVFGETQYEVNWEDGSTLQLLECDKWVLLDDFEKKNKSKLQEQKDSQGHHNPAEFLDIFENFRFKFLFDYLKMVRDSGITNMFGAAPYLYVGREKIEQEMNFKDLEGEEFEDMLNNADKAKDVMIQGTVNYLESKNKEISVENVKSHIGRLSNKILIYYMTYYR